MLLKDRRKLIIIGVVAVALIIGAVFFIFSRGKSADDYVKEYYGYLENKEYGKMYNMLTKGSLAKTSQKVFEARYKNIYEGIEAKNIEIKIGEVEDGIVNYTLTMDTLAGKISSENKVEVKDGELVYNEAMILEGLKEDYKIKINVICYFNTKLKFTPLHVHDVLAQDGISFRNNLINLNKGAW